MQFLRYQLFKLQLLAHIGHFSFHLAKPTLRVYRISIFVALVSGLSVITLVALPSPKPKPPAHELVSIPTTENYALLTLKPQEVEQRRQKLIQAVDLGITHPSIVKNLYLLEKDLESENAKKLLLQIEKIDPLFATKLLTLKK